MSTVDFCKLPKFMHALSNRCEAHNIAYEVYCPVHSCPCCSICAFMDHQTCQDMKPLDAILKDIKSSAAIPILKQDLQDLGENFQEVMNYLLDRMKTINVQNDATIEKVRTMRKLVDDCFDKLEKKIVDDVKYTHSKIKSETEALVTQIEYRAKRVGKLHFEFSIMTKYATDYQTFIGLRDIEETLSQEAQYLEELTSGSQIDDKNAEVTLSPALQSVLQDIKSFGNVSIKSSPSGFKLKTGRKDQAQILVVPVNHGIEQIAPILITTLQIPEGKEDLDIISCHILTDGTILLLDQEENQMIHFSMNGTFKKDVAKFREAACDICYVKDDTVAVTLSNDNDVVLIDVKENKVVKNIHLSHQCFGVSSNGEVLVISHKKERSIVIVNINDMSEEILEGIEVDRITMFKAKIYGTNISNDKISCHRMTGELLWTFTSQDIIRPTGISVDMHGCVYIVSSGNDKIVVLSSDGKTNKAILCEEDAICGPFAIDINRKTGTMLVSSFTGDSDNAFVFKI